MRGNKTNNGVLWREAQQHLALRTESSLQKLVSCYRRWPASEEREGWFVPRVRDKLLEWPVMELSEASWSWIDYTPAAWLQTPPFMLADPARGAGGGGAGPWHAVGARPARYAAAFATPRERMFRPPSPLQQELTALTRLLDGGAAFWDLVEEWKVPCEEARARLEGEHRRLVDEAFGPLTPGEAERGTEVGQRGAQERQSRS